MMWLRINCVDVPAVMVDMETKWNKTLAPVQWQVPVLAVRAVRSAGGTVLLLGPVGFQGPSLGCRHSGGGEATQSRALNKSLKSGPFKYKLWPVQRKRISVCIEGSGTENLPPTASSFKGTAQAAAGAVITTLRGQGLCRAVAKCCV